MKPLFLPYYLYGRFNFLINMNNATLLKLEFIQSLPTLCLCPFEPLHLPAKSSTSVENSLQINPFYAKQTQFDGGPNEHKLNGNNEVWNFRHFDGWENKANSNPNKANFGPISRVSKPKQTQFKANLPSLRVSICSYLREKNIYFWKEERWQK